MTCFATCSYPDCLSKIPYKSTDLYRPRYCTAHLKELAGRLNLDAYNPDITSFWIKVTPEKPTVQVTL